QNMIDRFWQKQSSKPDTLPYGLQEIISNGNTPSHGLFILIDSFIDSILDGNDPFITGDDALQTQELMNAITLSAIKRKTVDLPLDPNEYDQAFDELVQGAIKIPRFHHKVSSTST